MLKFYTIKFYVILICILWSSVVMGQGINSSSPIIPFGSNASYQYGMMPTNLPTGGAYGRSTDAANAYITWKNSYTASCADGSIRVKFDDPNLTVSEGIAYGMLLSAYAADKDLFDGLWKYYLAHKNGNGLMNWQISGCGSATANGSNGATDAELDAAIALLVAETQWPMATTPYDYKAEATYLINKIKQYEIDAPATYQANNGDGWGNGTDCRNPSYQAPAYYKLFADVVTADATFWNTSCVNGAYTLIQNNTSGVTTGLVSDWSNKAGTANACQANSQNQYGYDACRNPWRMATDVIWFNETRGATQCNKIANYINTTGGGASGCGGPRAQNGSGSGGHFATFVSTYAAGIMGSAPATYQNLMNQMYNQTVGVSDAISTGSPSGYFGNTLRCVALFMMSGNFWKPGTSVTPEINVQFRVSAAPLVYTNALSGTTLDLGNVQQGTNGDFTFSIQNLGQQTLTISNPTITNVSGKFSILTNPSTTSIAGNSTTTFVVRFSPTGPGALSETITITNNDPNGSEAPYTITVTATGTTTATAPEIDVQQNSVSIPSGNSPAFGMGNVTQNAIGFKTFTVTNTGTATLTTTFAISGSQYAFYGTTPTTIAAGASATFTVQITASPTAAGTSKTGSVTITNNDANEGTYVINLTTPIVSCATSIAASKILNDYEGNVNVTFVGIDASALFSATAANPSQTGINTSPIVASITRDPAKTYVQLRYTPGCSGTAFDMSNAGISIMVYSPAAGIPLLLSPKTSAGVVINADYSSDAKAVTSKVNQWEKIFFDLSAIKGKTNVGILDFMIDATPAAGSPTRKYYIDEIRYETEAPCNTTLPSTQIFMDYESNKNLNLLYANGTLDESFANPSATGLNTSALVARYTRPGTGAYQGIRYRGCQSKIDLTNKSVISILVRTGAAGVPINISLQSAKGNNIGSGVVTTTAANTWERMYFDFTTIKNADTIAYLDIYPDPAIASATNLTYYFDDIKYDVIPCTVAPTTAAAGPDQNVCATSATLAATAATSGTGSWTVISGIGTVTTPTSPTSTVTGLVSGTPVTLRWSVAKPGCTTSVDDVTITPTDPVAPTITFADITKVYGDAAFNLAATSNSSGAITYSIVTSTPASIVTVTSGGAVTITGAGTATIRASQAAGGCYTSGTKDITLTINKANRTITFTSAATGQMGTTITLAATVSPAASPVFTVANGTGTATITSGTTLNLTGAGTVTVTATVAADANYNAATQTQNVTITPQTAPTITFADVTKVYGDADFTMTATSTSPAAITYSITAGGTFATIDATTGLVHILGAGTVTVQASQPSSGGFSAATKTATLTIGKANRTITITSASSGQTGGSVALTATVTPAATVIWSVTNGTGSATVSGSNLTLVSAGTVTVNANIAGDANYNAASATQNFTITSLTVPTIAFADVTKVYGDADFTMTATSNSPGAITYSITTGSTFATIDANTGLVHILGAGSVTVQASQAASGGFAATTKTAALTINKANRTITITSASTGQTGGSVALTATVTPVATVTWSVTNGTGSATVSGSTLTLASAGTVTVNANIAGDANYNAASATQNFTITALTVPTIAFADVTKVFGDADFTMTATSNSPGAITYSITTGSTFATIDANTGLVHILGAGSVTVQASQAASGGFAATTKTAALTINKANRTITITSASTGQTGGSVALTATVAPVATVTWSVTNGTGSATVSGSTLTLASAGTVTVNANIAGDANYNAASATQNFTITSLTVPTITFADVTKIYGDADFNMTATSTSPGAITYSITAGGSFATIDANTGLVHILGAGSVTVQASQAASGGFAANTKTATLTINKANRSITITSANSGVANTSVALTATVAPSGSVVWSVTNGTGSATVSGSTLTLVSAGTVTVTADIAGDANFNAATASQSFTINTANAPEIEVTVANGAILSGGTYNFGDQAQGTTGSAFTVSIINSGNVTLNLVAINWGGSNVSDFPPNYSTLNATVLPGTATSFSVSFAPTTLGTRTANFTIVSDDSDESSFLVNLTGNGTVATSVRNGIRTNALEVTPNPSEGIFNVNFKSGFTGEAEMNVRNALGEVVFTHHASSTNYDINLQQLPAGVYILEIKTEEGVAVERIVKQ